jgi:hypothetical protein
MALPGASLAPAAQLLTAPGSGKKILKITRVIIDAFQKDD